MSETNLAERRADLENRIAEFHVGAGKAMLDGETIPPAGELADMEHELATIRAAEMEAMRRQRELEIEQRRELHAKRIAERRGLESKLTVAYEKADDLAKQFRVACEAIVQTSNDLRDNYRAAGDEAPLDMFATEQWRRLGHKLSRRLRGVTHTMQFGDIILRIGPEPRPRPGPTSTERVEMSWAEDEARYFKQKDA